MKSLDLFLPDILDDLPNVPSMVAERHIIRAARRFCIETEIWSESITVPLIGAKQSSLTVQPSNTTQAEIYSLSKIYLDGREVPIYNDTQLDVRQDGVSWTGTGVVDHRNGEGLFFAVRQLDRNTFKLIQTPEDAVEKSLLVESILIPKVTAYQLMDDLYNYHLEAIKAGTKSTLMIMRDQPWSAPDHASYWRREFENAIEKEARFQRRGSTNRPMRVRNRAFV